MGSEPAQQAMLSEGSDPANPPKQTFINVLKNTPHLPADGGKSGVQVGRGLKKGYHDLVYGMVGCSFPSWMRRGWSPSRLALSPPIDGIRLRRLYTDAADADATDAANADADSTDAADADATGSSNGSRQERTCFVMPLKSPWCDWFTAFQLARLSQCRPP